jgi:transposase
LIGRAVASGDPHDKAGTDDMMQGIVIGVDIAKARLDVFIGPQRRHLALANTPAGCRRLAVLAGELAGAGEVLVVFEATGIFDRLLGAVLAQAGIAHARVNPRRAREFARAAGLLAKTDRVDARMLALMGERLELRRAGPADPQAGPAQALFDRRAQLVDERKRLKTQLKQMQRLGQAAGVQAAIVAEMRQALAELSGRIAAYARALERQLAQAPALARRTAIARSLPGFGPVVAAAYALKAPEFGALDRRGAAALIGVAPLACDSGALRGKRRCWGGRKPLRDLLHMAALTARRHGRFKALYDRLIAKGKARKAALTAVGRKLVTILNALIKADTPYDPLRA